MSHPTSQPSAPQQLFDGSFFEAILNAPALKITPPDVAIAVGEGDEAPDPDETALLEVETFDWDSYNRAFFERVPDSAKRTQQGRAMAQIAGTQIWMAKRLPVEVVGYLLQNTPCKTLWTYLNRDDHRELLHALTRGFQRTPSIVRHPVVRGRLLHWLGNNDQEIYVLLLMWSLSEPQPPSIALVQSEGDERELGRALPLVLKKCGVSATVAALCVAARPKALRALGELLADKDAFERLLESAEESPSPPPPTEVAPAPDSDAARFWKDRCEQSEAAQSRAQHDAEQLLDLSEKLEGQLRAQKRELEKVAQREKTALATAEKKLAGSQKRATAELEELRTLFERQGRKLRALEREKLDFETENRRVKKQLRHTGLLLEAERQKVAVSEAKASENEAPPVEAISTPAASQSAPNKPIVVQSPTPLDEIFEWRADGRPIKITPRAVRRLIDSNDEDAVFGIMQALESLRHRDASLHGKFLKRLGEAGAYYARVLSERMTRVLVDASNVARHTPNRYGKGQLNHLLAMRDELRRLDCFPILLVADASLPYFIDQAPKLREMIHRGEIWMADKGVEADEILAREARRTGAYVVTNDAKFFHKVSPDFEPPRVTFRIYDGTIIVDDF